MLRRRQPAVPSAMSGHLGTPAQRILACAILALLIGASVASATNFSLVKRVGLYSGYTTHAACPRGQPIDPINVVWSGNSSSVTPASVANVFSNRIGWTHDDYQSPYGADNQYVIRYPGHYCQRDAAQRADDCAICNRNHVRLFPSYITGYGSPYHVVGDVHHDENVANVSCTHALVIPVGHIASDFNKTRNMVVKKWTALGGGYAGVFLRRWRNDQPLRQCDGSYHSSDGYVAFLHG